MIKQVCIRAEVLWERQLHSGNVYLCYSIRISASGTGNLHIWKGSIAAERYKQVLESNIWPLLQGRPCMFQQDKVKPHPASVPAARLRSRRVQLLHWAACSPDVSQPGNICTDLLQSRCFTTWKHLKYNKEEPGLLYQTGTGQRSSARGPAAALLSSRCFQMLLKEEGMLHSGKHDFEVHVRWIISGLINEIYGQPDSLIAAQKVPD